MKKSITILTSEESFHNNYGAALQGYALFSTLQEMDLAPQIVRYQGGQFQDSAYRYYLMQAKRRIRLFIEKLHSYKSEKRYYSKKFADKIRLRECLFLSFLNENMVFYNKRRMTWQRLKKNYPHTDYYICGSDQIWNPYFKGGRNDPGYFLQFAPKDAKKIAYAPSFGCKDLPPKSQKTIKEYLSSFDALSVRENSGVEIISKYTGLPSRVVLDPTLIRSPEQWKAIARLPKGLPDRYILCYRFADSQQTKQKIDKISAMTGLPVISMPLSIPSLRDENYQFVFEAGPREFIGLIENAELVCTDSFHATVFSILMKTPALVFLRENYEGGDSMNSRVYSLLENLNLTQMIVTPNQEVDTTLINQHIDFDRVHWVLKTMRAESLDFLRNALDN